MMRSQLVEQEKFSEFYEKWMEQLNDYLMLLFKVAQEIEKNSEKEIHVTIVNKLTAHHKEFYKVKWADEDVLAFFNPPWLTPLEKAYQWVTGWKPSMFFRLLETLKRTSLAGMTEEQTQKIEALRLNIKSEEEKVEREMERQQMRIADPNIVELMRIESIAQRNGDSTTLNRVNSLIEAALRGRVDGLKNVMKMADCARLETLEGVLNVLNLMQCVNFLVATTMFQIR